MFELGELYQDKYGNVIKCVGFDPYSNTQFAYFQCILPVPNEANKYFHLDVSYGMMGIWRKEI